MDKASDFGSEDCRFESCRGRSESAVLALAVFFLLPPARAAAPGLPWPRYRARRTHGAPFAREFYRPEEGGGAREAAPWERAGMLRVAGPARTALVLVTLKAPSPAGGLGMERWVESRMCAQGAG